MSCHAELIPGNSPVAPLIILAGQPNVGKSVLFQRLTGRYATVSNFPGTTVEIAQGTLQVGSPKSRPGSDNRQETLVVDSPGINSLQSRAEDERVTRHLLLQQQSQTVIQVADAKNLARGLYLTIQLAELNMPLILDLNMVDEAQQQGIVIDHRRLADLLGIPVATTVATRGEGIEDLIKILDQGCSPQVKVAYDPAIELAIQEIVQILTTTPGRGTEKLAHGERGLALMLLCGDEEMERELDLDAPAMDAIRAIQAQVQGQYGGTTRLSLTQAVTQQRWQLAIRIMAQVVLKQGRDHHAGMHSGWQSTWNRRLGYLAVHPIAGWPVLFLVLFLVYKFVGEFGAGTLVDLIEGTVFGEWIVPGLKLLLDQLLPIALLQDFLVGEYGLVTVGLAYGFAIVLPIVSTFFLAFGLLEDSGYLSRIAVMVNRLFKIIGLNGKAVLPLVLGLGCVTMATMTTRILETRRERLLVTLLLALSIPCSAQLGVVLAMIYWLDLPAILIWAGVVLGVLLLVGWLAAQVLPGETPDFILELPPLRRPMLDNILLKTVARLEWYLKEVIPLFLIATVGLFVLARTGVLGGIEQLATPLVVNWLGLPPQTAGIFLVGFLRRDYGAVGLLEMARNGLLTPDQILVSLVVITLFVPCVATVMMIAKEHGARTAAAIVGFVFPFAFLVGGLIHLLGGG